MSREILTLASNDLACYAVATHPEFELANHTRAIIDKLEAVERGEIKRLMILCPPRHGKSMLASEIFVAWYFGRHPDRYVISASYSSDLASDFGRKVRNSSADPLHNAIFPKCKLADDSGGQQKFSTTAKGSYFAVGRGSALTGRGAHLLLLDDLIKDRAEADSEVIRKGLHDWWERCLHSTHAGRGHREHPNDVARGRSRWPSTARASWRMGCIVPARHR